MGSLISSDFFPNINCLQSLIQINFKNKQAKTSFYFKIKLIQVSVIALPD